MNEILIRPYSYQEFRLYSLTRAYRVCKKGKSVRGFPSILLKDSRVKTVKSGTPFIEFRDLTKGYNRGKDETENGRYTHVIGGGVYGRQKTEGKKSKTKSMFFKFRFSSLESSRAYAEYMPRTNDERTNGIYTGKRDAVLIELVDDVIRLWFFEGMGTYSAELFAQWCSGRLCMTLSDDLITV